MGITVRTATADDLAALRELVQERDDALYALEHVSTVFSDLQSDAGRTWLAEIDGEPAGTTSVVWRDLQGAGRAAYWTNLYVRPKFRARMIYPLLVTRMQAALKQEGIAPCYCVIRRPRVLVGHVKLKFQCVAEYAVLARPLRPARLAARALGHGGAALRQRAVGIAAAAARPIDALAVAATRVLARPGLPVRDGWPEELAPLTSGRPPGSIVWSTTQLAARLRPALDGEPYHTRRVGSHAALVWRLARRDAVQAAAILDLVGTDPTQTRRLLRAACDEATRAGADVALWLDGAPDQHITFRRAGFITTSERYSMVAWPPGSLDARVLRFVFLDHDAF
jgi:hypothetical protein